MRDGSFSVCRTREMRILAIDAGLLTVQICAKTVGTDSDSKCLRKTRSVDHPDSGTHGRSGEKSFLLRATSSQ